MLPGFFLSLTAIRLVLVFFYPRLVFEHAGKLLDFRRRQQPDANFDVAIGNRASGC